MDRDSQVEALRAKLSELAPGSPERALYLEKLKRAVQSGAYQVDAHEIARKLIDDALKKSP